MAGEKPLRTEDEMGDLPMLHGSRDQLAEEYVRIYGMKPPETITTMGLRSAVLDNRGVHREPIKVVSDALRLRREEARIREERSESNG